MAYSFKENTILYPIHRASIKQIAICNFDLAKERKIIPEIGKAERPVVIIHAHRRMRSVIALPLTSQKPNKALSVYIPKEKLFGMLKKQNSWVLCDMIYHLSNDRLFPIYDKEKNIYLHSDRAKLDDEIYSDIIAKVKGLF